ncbi:YrhB domain-containing protein [Winogradskya humida]|uniref:Immunity protein 35 domain-containing protein n=1 Tax=Winogradskya humida TaxID=113566 RepID=A0ABQ3ZTE2_9ACTN|nr:YrhB domain-containing protein [Actinoplanes humidus]GIE21808.1 hypothetical protein Ahu01nite_049100 [Actinoplanes humidus]
MISEDSPMDLTEARTLAEAKLRELESPDAPLQLNEQYATEIPWAWYFPFNTARYFETRQFSDSAPSGPIVVNKDGSDIWVAGSAAPLEKWLNQYAEEHGYPLVPLPPTRSAF